MNKPLKTIALACQLFIAGAVLAQNTAPGQYISSDKKDTSVSSHYTDNPQDHLHQTTTPVQNGNNNAATNGAGTEGTSSGNTNTADNNGQEVRNGYEGSTGNANLGENAAPNEQVSGKKPHAGMLNAAVGLFGMGALIGLYLLSFILSSSTPPKIVAGLHGILVLTGLGLLIAYACINTPAPITSIVLYGVAAAGGFTVLYLDVSKKEIPKWLPVVHGLIGLSGFITLLVFAYA